MNAARLLIDRYVPCIQPKVLKAVCWHAGGAHTRDLINSIRTTKYEYSTSSILLILRKDSEAFVADLSGIYRTKLKLCRRAFYYARRQRRR